MNKVKEFGLGILTIAMLPITVLAIILWAIMYFIIYKCFCVYEDVVLYVWDDDCCDAWDETMNIYAECIDAMKGMILDLKIEL